MNKKIFAFASSVANTFCDFTLDLAINKYSVYKILFYTSLISFLFQVIYGLQVGIEFNLSSIPIILFYGIAMLLGYLCYVKSLKCLPIGFAGLLENLDLFLVLIIDIILGYITINLRFIILFLLFIISILWFGLETNKLKDEIKIKKIKWIGITFILLSILFYTSEPYLIKIASSTGANEVAINFGYSLFAIPFFFVRSKGKESKEGKKIKKE